MLSALSTSVAAERRHKIRYPVQLAAFYRLLGPVALSGVGETLNVSSSGILLTCRDTLAVGGRIEVILQWPSMLDASVPLQLVTRGRIIRTRGMTYGIRFTHHQFRTTKRIRIKTLA